MTEPAATDDSRRSGGAGVEPVLDLGAVLAAMQDQLDDLTAALEAQQRTIDELLRGHRAGRPAGPASGPRNGTGRR